MPRLYIVFDANAYRALSDQDFRALMAAERANGIVAQANYYVVSELTAHLASEEDAGFKRSWSAMRRLATHTSFYDGSQARIRFSGDAEDQLCHVLFDASPADRADQPGEYAELIQAIAQAETFTGLAAQSDFIHGISVNVAQEEVAWVTYVWDNLVIPFAADAKGWSALQDQPLIRRGLAAYLRTPEALRSHARSMVERAATAVGITVDPPARDALVDIAVHAFSIPLRLFLLVLSRIIETGYDLSKRQHMNTLWDLQVAHAISPLGRIAGCPIWLITNDKLILDAVRGTPAALLVRSLNSYTTLVRGDPEALLDEIRQSGDLGWDSML